VVEFVLRAEVTDRTGFTVFLKDCADRPAFTNRKRIMVAAAAIDFFRYENFIT
jgi:hypothetical protein